MRGLLGIVRVDLSLGGLGLFPLQGFFVSAAIKLVKFLLDGFDDRTSVCFGFEGTFAVGGGSEAGSVFVRKGIKAEALNFLIVDDERIH